MDTIDFFVPGTPVPQGRPRFRRFKTKEKGEFVSTYDPKTARDWKKTVTDHVKKLHLKPFPAGLPLAVQLAFYLERPKSAPKSRLHPIVKPDLDNLVKGVKDALKGIVWADDSQVCKIKAAKHYTTAGGAGVWVGVLEVKE